MFHIGEEVVCVDDVFSDGKRPIMRGQHYIVRWVGAVDDTPCICVEGVVRPVDGEGIRMFLQAKTLSALANMLFPDDPRTKEMEKKVTETESLMNDFPMRASRFRSLKKDHVEDMKQFLNVVPTKVLEDA